MTQQMTHRERVSAALLEEQVDRPPGSMWRHFFQQETTAEGLAEAMLGFQRRYDWDFMKVNPRASYHAEAWGVETRYTGNQPPEVVGTPVKNPEDWSKLEVLDVNQGVLAEQLHALELIAGGIDPDVPFLETVFTPCSVASRLAPSAEVFLEHLRSHTDQVKQGLEVITETFINFSKACLDRGASGLFFATTSWATTHSLSEEEYVRFARPCDLKVLKALSEAEFHILHVCQDNNLLPALTDYPVHAFNWDARGNGNPSLAEGKALIGDRAAIGGIAHRTTLGEATTQELAGEVRGLRAAMGAKGWMLGTGCTYASATPEANVQAIRQALR